MGDCPRCASDHFFNGECEHCKYPYGTPSHVEFLREIREAIERQDKSLAKIYESVERAEKIIEKIIKHTEQVHGCPNCGSGEFGADGQDEHGMVKCIICGYRFAGDVGIKAFTEQRRR